MTFDELEQQARNLRGCDLKTYHCLIKMTKGGKRAIRVAVAILVQKTGYSARMIWRSVKNLAEAGLITVRRRAMRIGGIVKKIANEYRLTRPSETVIAKVKRVTGGWKRAVCAMRVALTLPKNISEDAFTRSADSNDAIERARARMKAYRC